MSAAVLPYVIAECCDIDPSGGGVFEDASGAGTNYDNTYARCAIRMQPGYSGASGKWSAASTFFDQFELFHGGNNVTDAGLRSLMCAGIEVFRMQVSGGGFNPYTYKFLSLQGGVLTSVGTFTLPAGKQRWAIELVAGASGAVHVFSSGTEVITATGLNHSGFAGVDQVIPRGCGVPFNGGDAYWSQGICDTVSHIGDVVGTCPPTGNGANTAWTGDYTSVNEVVYSDASKITSTAANDIETYTSSASFSGTVYAVVASARSNCGSTGPQNEQLALRRGSTNYFSSSIAQSAGLAATQDAWKTDPSTSTTWVMADALSAEFGVKAIA